MRAVVAGAVAAATVSAALAVTAAVVLRAGAVESMAAAEDQGQPLVGSGRDDRSL